MSEAKLPTHYEWIRELFKGPHSSVSLVYHRERQKKYLVKALVNSSHWRRKLDTKNRIKKEIDFVSSFEHPHISKLEDSHFNDNAYLLFYPYHEGNTLHQLLKENHSFSTEESINLCQQLLSALDYIHSRGIVHCDINPNNIYLKEDGKVQLFDFGLGLPEKEWKYDASVKIVGTPPYMAPEQAGLTEHRIDRRTDLYCTGMVLYRLLAGNLPHKLESKQLSEYMQVMLKQELPAIPKISEHLNLVVSKALSLDPKNRYQTAGGFRYDLLHPEEQPGKQDSLLAVRLKSHFIQRLEELAVLRNCWEKSKRGTGGNLLFYGNSGVGKTEILREFQSELKHQGHKYLSVKCNRFTPNHPLSVYQELIGALIHTLTDTPENSSQLTTSLNREFSQHSGLLCDIIPELKSLFTQVLPAPKVSEDALRDRQHHVLSSFLQSLLHLQSPVVFLDDLQWMDTSSFQLIEEVIKEKNCGLFVFLYRTEAQKDLQIQGNKLDMGLFDSVLEVKPFTRTDVAAFFDQYLGTIENGEELVEAVVHQTDCTPLTLRETLQHLLESGRLINSTDKWRFKSRDMQSLTAADLYLKRFEKLPDDHKRLLQSISFLQGTVDQKTIQAALHFSPEDYLAQMNTLMESGFLTESIDGQLEFPHDKLQEVVEDSLSRDDTISGNLLWGRYFEDRLDGNPQAVYQAYQYYRQAGDTQKELDLAYRAAGYSFDNFAYIEEKNYYAACLRMLQKNPGLTLPPETSTYMLQKRLGDVLIILGDNEEALEVLLKIVEEAEAQSPREYLDVHLKIGSVYSKRSEFDKAGYHFGICMKGLKTEIPESNGLLVLGSLWEGLVFFLARRPYQNRELDQTERFTIDVISKFGYALFHTNLVACTYSAFKTIGVCKSTKISPESCIGLTQSTVVLYSHGFKKTACTIAHSTARKLDRVNLPEAYSHSGGMLAMLYNFDCDWNNCIKISRKSIEQSKKFGTKWARVMANEYLCLTYFRQGNLNALKTALKDYLQDTESGTDPHFYYKAHTLARLRTHFTGEPHPDLDVQTLRKRLLTTPWGLLKLINSARLIPTLETNEAYQFGERILSQIKHKYFSHEFLADLLLAHLNTLSTLLWDASGKQKKNLLKKFRSYLLPCMTKAAIFKAHSGPTFNATAWYCHFKGWRRLSHHYFRKAIKRNHSLDMRLEEARSYNDYATVLEKQGAYKEALSHFRSALDLYNYCGAYALAKPLEQKLNLHHPPKARVADPPSNKRQTLRPNPGEATRTLYTYSNAIRFDEIYQLSQSICELNDRNTLLKQTLRAFIKGTHAQEGYLELFPNSSENLVQMHMNTKGGVWTGRPLTISLNVLRRVRETKKAYRFQPAAEEGILEPSRRTGTLSLLCYPLVRENSMIGYVYLTNHKLAGLFTAGTEKICDIIGAQTLLLLESFSLLNRQAALKQKLKEKVKAQTENIQKQNREIESSNQALIRHECWKDSILEASVEQLKNHKSLLENQITDILTTGSAEKAEGVHLELAVRACRDMGVLADNLSDVSHMESGKFPLNKKRLTNHDIQALLRKITAHPVFEQKNMNVAFDFTREAFQIHWDPYLLERVFQNLIANAAKYTPAKGDVRILAGLREQNFRISIFNSGTPIPPEVTEMIFHRYNRISNQPSPYSKGLGLFFCHLACRAHGCRIWVEPAQDGNHFHLSLPAGKNNTHHIENMETNLIS